MAATVAGRPSSWISLPHSAEGFTPTWAEYYHARLKDKTVMGSLWRTLGSKCSM